eukprot:scaffold16487_cov91-Isochrysis_galbana.AAC.1
MGSAVSLRAWAPLGSPSIWAMDLISQSIALPLCQWICGRTSMTWMPTCRRRRGCSSSRASTMALTAGRSADDTFRVCTLATNLLSSSCTPGIDSSRLRRSPTANAISGSSWAATVRRQDPYLRPVRPPDLESMRASKVEPRHIDPGLQLLDRPSGDDGGRVSVGELSEKFDNARWQPCGRRVADDRGERPVEAGGAREE